MWRRTLPLARTVVGLWLGWRWLRIQRRLLGHERTSEATRRFHRAAAAAVVRRALRQQGLIVKTCQFLGSRADILMDEYVRTLSLVHDQVPPRPWSEMRPVIERELGGSMAELYTDFDIDPVAAASLAQVYRARLHDGTAVAVKVQYPGIDRIVRDDLRALRMLVEIWARIEKVIDFRPVVDEMERTAPEEVDFIHEGEAAERLASLLADRDDDGLGNPVAGAHQRRYADVQRPPAQIDIVFEGRLVLLQAEQDGSQLRPPVQSPFCERLPCVRRQGYNCLLHGAARPCKSVCKSRMRTRSTISSTGFPKHALTCLP